MASDEEHILHSFHVPTRKERRSNRWNDFLCSRWKRSTKIGTEDLAKETLILKIENYEISTASTESKLSSNGKGTCIKLSDEFKSQKEIFQLLKEALQQKQNINLLT